MRQSLNRLCAGTGAKCIVDVDRTQMHAGQNGGARYFTQPSKRHITPTICWHHRITESTTLGTMVNLRADWYMWMNVDFGSQDVFI